MSCKSCASGNERTFQSEIVLTYPELKNLNRGPVYICQEMVVCLDCGHSELSIPRAELEKLNASGDLRPAGGSRGDRSQSS